MTHVAFPGPLVLLVLLDIQEDLGSRELPELLEIQDDRRSNRVNLLLPHRANLVREVHQDLRDLQVHRVILVISGHQALLVLRDTPESRDKQDRRVQTESLEALELQENQVRMLLRKSFAQDLQVNQGLQGPKGHQVQWDSREQLVFQDHKGRKDLQVWKAKVGRTEFPAHQDNLERQACPANAVFVRSTALLTAESSLKMEQGDSRMLTEVSI